MIDTRREINAKYRILRKGYATGIELSAVSGKEPNITMAKNGTIHMSMSGTFINNPDVDFLNDEIAPALIINGITYPLGVYSIGTFTENADEYGQNTANVEAYDRALKLSQTRTETRLSFAKGTPYKDAIKTLLKDAGIIRVIEEQNEDVLASAREDWEIGTDYLTIINGLLEEINFNHIWFDLEGNAVLEQYKALENRIVKHEYRAGEFSIIKAAYEKEYDVFAAPNVFMAIVSNPDYDTPMVATGVNDNALSALSTIRRGRRIMAPPVQLDNIASQAALQIYVNNLASQSMLSEERTTFTTAINPKHSVGDMILLDNGNLRGLYEETDWTMTLKAGAQMTHKAKRMVLV